jgi:hypothetical protein
MNANRVLKFDPETQQLPSIVGDDMSGVGESRRVQMAVWISSNGWGNLLYVSRTLPLESLPSL